MTNGRDKHFKEQNRTYVRIISKITGKSVVHKTKYQIALETEGAIKCSDTFRPSTLYAKDANFLLKLSLDNFV